MSDDPKVICGWFKAWHPRGVMVTLPVPFASPEEMFKSVEDYFNVGFLAREVGLEVGESKEEIGWVLRGSTQKGDPLILLYSANDSLTWSFLTVYPDSPERREAFEHASGLRLDSLPEYGGSDKPQRGAGPKGDKFIVKAPKAFAVVWKQNPKFLEAPAGEDTRTNTQKRKRDFVRWDGAKPSESHNPEDRITTDQINELDGLILTLDQKRPQKFDLGRFLSYLNTVHKTDCKDIHDLGQDHYRTAREQLQGMLKKAGA